MDSHLWIFTIISSHQIGLLGYIPILVYLKDKSIYFQVVALLARDMDEWALAEKKVKKKKKTLYPKGHVWRPYPCDGFDHKIIILYEFSSLFLDIHWVSLSMGVVKWKWKSVAKGP